MGGKCRPRGVPADQGVVGRAHHRAQVVELTPKEFGFLSVLARNAGRVLTHRMILKEVWGPTYGDETQYLRVYEPDPKEA